MEDNISLGEEVVLYFVRYPQPGKVKTRLGAEIGYDKAAEVYREIAEVNLKQCEYGAARKRSLIIAFDDLSREKEIREWLPGPFIYYAQEGSGLGERLRHAFSYAFARKARRVIALGSDTLGMTASEINQAFSFLKDTDIVVGPAKDGGYYLIGQSREEPSVFDHVNWSTESVFERTLTNCKQAGLSFSVLPVLEDLDRAEDYKTYQAGRCAK